MSIDDLYLEYHSNKKRINEHVAYVAAESDRQAKLAKEGKKDDETNLIPLHRYFIHRLKLKHKHIKMQLNAKTEKEIRIANADRTDENFHMARSRLRHQEAG